MVLAQVPQYAIKQQTELYSKQASSRRTWGLPYIRVFKKYFFFPSCWACENDSEGKGICYKSRDLSFHSQNPPRTDS